MERWKRKNQRKTKVQSFCCAEVDEHVYHEVEDHEEVSKVKIQPARPFQDESEYADRDLPRSAAAYSLCSKPSDINNPPPTCPPRAVHPNPGPHVHRNVKPYRRSDPLDDQVPSKKSTGQHSQLLLRTPPCLTKGVVNQLSNLNLQSTLGNEQRERKRLEFDTKCAYSSERESANHTGLRFSLDLEAANSDARIRSKVHQPEQSAQGRSQLRLGHHEWPQTKDDLYLNDADLQEKPQQTCNNQDWYIRMCNRAEAENVLHLVNKDGAFLVRDCSKSTSTEPCVLAVYYEQRVYNIKIRFIKSTNKYALGTGKRVFDSVAEIVKFHSMFPIGLVDGRNPPTGKYSGKCVLVHPVTQTDVDQLLG